MGTGCFKQLTGTPENNFWELLGACASGIKWNYPAG